MPTSRSNKPTVLVTIGDPSGIGPEVALKALASPEISGLANFLAIGDRFVIEKAKRDFGLALKFPILDISNVSCKKFSYGKTDPSLGRASIEYVDKALKLLKKKKADCLVTAPINKSSVRGAGLSRFEGHTEYLAEKTRTKDFAMMFVGKNLNVSLVTRHIALNSVARSITADRIYKTIRLTHLYLKKYFNIRNPRIGVAGLNPHAGEEGAFGDEEEKLIIPAIRKASKYLKEVHGPIPGDVVFVEALNKRYDAVVSMYHDQGLVPFKLLHFKNGVNLTLGLPFIRTSPDHGTAFNIAGRGIADATSMKEAIKLACRLSKS